MDDQMMEGQEEKKEEGMMPEAGEEMPAEGAEAPEGEMPVEEKAEDENAA